MDKTKQIFHNEIEVERMRMALEQGPYFFFPALAYTSTIVLSLWNHFSHFHLLSWFVTLNAITLVIWGSHYLHRKRIDTMNLSGILKIKIFFFLGGLAIGIVWGVGNLIFVDLAEPYTLLVMTASSYFASVGLLFLWFNFWPAIVAFLIPAALPFIIQLMQQKDLMSYGLVLGWVVAVASATMLCFRTRQSWLL